MATQRQYGIEANFQFNLVEADGVDFATGIEASGQDTYLMSDGAEAIQTTNVFTGIESGAYYITLTAAEMQFTGSTLNIIDFDGVIGGTKLYLDNSIEIETYGHASSMHPDIGDPIMAELTGDMGATPTRWEGQMLLYMAFRNKGTSDTGLLTIHNDAGVQIASGTLTDISDLFTRNKLSS